MVNGDTHTRFRSLVRYFDLPGHQIVFKVVVIEYSGCR
jgi:hypothetical protein